MLMGYLTHRQSVRSVAPMRRGALIASRCCHIERTYSWTDRPKDGNIGSGTPAKLRTNQPRDFVHTDLNVLTRIERNLRQCWIDWDKAQLFQLSASQGADFHGRAC